MKKILALLGLSVALAAQARAEEITLRVANYGGVFSASQKKYAADLFTQRTGIKIQFIDGNPADHLAKMIASKGREAPYDLVYIDDDVQAKAIAAGVLEKLDPALVPNLKFVYDEAKNKDGYGPGMIFYSVGVAYNVEKLKAAGIPEITSWADLWNPKLEGKVAVPDLSTIMGRDFLVAAARLNGGDEKTLEKGVEKIATLKAHSYYTSSATLATAFQGGDVWAAPWINGRTWGMIDKGAPMKYVLPKEGGFGNMTVIDLAAGAKYPKEAQAYINFVLDPLPQLGQANEIPYGPTNKVLAPVLAAYPDMAKKFPASPEDLKKLILVDWKIYNANHEKAVELWNRQVIRK
ncbi:MAG: ABC transporter substrate-binding protein [Chitinophagales bacterium]|nr:ABC transporter substrate-binding protein [Hyphomicrobiales bacterium]